MLDAVLLRVIPTVLYGVLFYPLMGLRGGATHVTLYFVVQAVFAAAVGMLAMSVTIGVLCPGPTSGSLTPASQDLERHPLPTPIHSFTLIHGLVRLCT